ncbi:1448_t:CDS:1, partial [Funneliformis geosporum]
MANSNQLRPYEKENYPISLEIIYYGNQKFNYTIIQEGIYLSAVKLCYIETPNYFPIPDNYIIQTTWSQTSNHCTIQCYIHYVEGIPHHLICFGSNFQYQVVSVQSLFDASVELHR